MVKSKLLWQIKVILLLAVLVSCFIKKLYKA